MTDEIYERIAATAREGIEEAEAEVAEIEREAEEKIAAVRDRIASLRKLEATARDGASTEGEREEKAPAPARQSSQRRPAPKRSQTSTRGAPTPAAAGNGAPPRRTAAGVARREAVLAFIRAHPGCSGREIEDALKMRQSHVSKITIKLAREGTIRAEKKGKGKAYSAAEAPSLPADDNGAKSALEREILSEVGDSAWSAAGLANRVGVPTEKLTPILAALVRRRALIRRGRAGAAFYERPTHPRTMSDRA